MTLPKEFSLPDGPSADFNVAQNLRLIYGMTIAHMDANLRHDTAIFPNYLLPQMFDLKSSMQALAITFEQLQWWCQNKGVPVETFLVNQALNDKQRKDITAIIELSTHALEKYPPTPEDHAFIGPITLNQFH